MKALAGIALVLASISAMADESLTTFNEYAAATEAAYTHSQRCKVEVTSRGAGERCDQFYDYLDRYRSISESFKERMMLEGDDAFGGASGPRMGTHRHYQDSLVTNMSYITEMMQ